MALLTIQQHQTLLTWGFLDEYVQHRSELIEIARIVYRAMDSLAPVHADAFFASVLGTSLLGTNLFSKILKTTMRHAKPDLYPSFAEAMARYLVDNDWREIVKT